MDSSVSPTPKPFNIPFIVGCAVIAAAVAYAWFIYRDCASYAGGSDSSGYLNSARLFAHGQLWESVRVVPGLIPPVWNYYFYQALGINVDFETGRMVPSYPIGVPVHYALASLIVGFEKAARVVNMLNALAAGGLLYALGRRLGLAGVWALGGVALLWACPVWIFQSLQPMSDSIATTWVIAAMLCTLRAREQVAWAAAGGAAFAIAVLVRPTSLVVIVPLLVLLGGNWRRWMAFILGGLPFAFVLGAYNHAVYGGIIESGYNHGGHYIFDAWEWRFLQGNLLHFARWIPQLISPLVALPALLGLPWLFRRTPRIAWLLVIWIGVLIALYACYFCAGETWWYLRFLLPGFPAVILAGLLALQMAARPLTGKWARLAPVLLLAISVGWEWRLDDRLHVTNIKDAEHNYWIAGLWVRDHVPADAILLTWQLSGSSLFYNTQPIVRWDVIEPAQFELLCQTAAKLHRPIYAPLYAFEKAELQKKLGGEWLAIAHPSKVTIWRLIGPKPPEVTP